MSEAGHNTELTPAEWKALKFDHFHKIAAQKAKVEAEQTEYKRLRKLAKADQIILSDIDFMLKCAEIEDEMILTDRIKREAEIAAWFALPIQFQSDMFDVGLEPIEDRAAREGEAAGYRGKEPTPPYDVSSTAGQAWLKRWHVGNEYRMADLATALEKKAVRSDGDELIAGHDSDDPFEDQREAVQETAE
jgi:hypothetical protein